MNRGTLNRATDGEVIDPAQCDYVSPIDGRACLADAGHEGGHSIGANPRYATATPIDADALLARVRELRAIDEESGAEIPAPRPEQVQALADLIRKK